MSSTILSTKVLTRSQQNLLLNAGLSYLHYDAIKVRHLEFELPKVHFDYLVFTSQNGVNSYFEHIRNPSAPQGQEPSIKGTFCVGIKTQSLLEEKGQKVLENAQNAADLGNTIIKKYKNESFLLVSGNRNLPTLPEKLKENNIRHKVIRTYNTSLNPKRFERDFDGVLFFSPSGVESFFQENNFSGTAYCIGNTTADEAKKYTSNYSIANKPTVENVIVQAVKQLT